MDKYCSTCGAALIVADTATYCPFCTIIKKKPKKDTDLLKKLHKHVYKLQKLLALGQHGHFSWCKAVSEEWKAIAKMWFKPEKPNIFLIEYKFKGKWYIRYSCYYSCFTSYDMARRFLKDNLNNISNLPLRIQGYTRITEAKK